MKQSVHCVAVRINRICIMGQTFHADKKKLVGKSSFRSSVSSDYHWFLLGNLIIWSRVGFDFIRFGF